MNVKGIKPICEGNLDSKRGFLSTLMVKKAVGIKNKKKKREDFEKQNVALFIDVKKKMAVSFFFFIFFLNYLKIENRRLVEVLMFTANDCINRGLNCAQRIFKSLIYTYIFY